MMDNLSGKRTETSDRKTDEHRFIFLSLVSPETISLNEMVFYFTKENRDGDGKSSIRND
jgi:hypothetical protein